MRSVTSSLQTAIDAHERVIRHEVLVDWDQDGTIIDAQGRVADVVDDVSHRMSSVVVTQSLESQLPEPVRVVPGVAVAELSVDIERGNVARYASVPAYRDATSASSGSTAQSATISVTRPTNARPGDLMLMALFTSTWTRIIAVPTKSNVTWGELGLRGDFIDDPDLGNQLTGYLLVRRVAINEPSTYTITLAGDGHNWIALPIAIADSGIAGIHALTNEGQDLGVAASAIVSGRPITTKLANCTFVSFFGAAAEVTGTGTWTALDGDTKRAEASTTATTAASNVYACVTTASGVAPGQYTKRAQLNFAVTANVQFTIAIAPMPAMDESQHAAWTFSELNRTSPFNGKTRTGRRMTWDVGLHTSAGYEKVRVFSGLSLTSEGRSRARSFQLNALDNRETLRTDLLNAFVPTVIAEHPELGFLSQLTNYPGLEATFYVSYLASHGLRTRAGGSPSAFGDEVGVGYFAAPPARTDGSTVLWVPCHGSLASFIGRGDYAYTTASSLRKRRVRFYDGPYVAGTEPAPPNGGSISAGWGCESTSTPWMTNGQMKGRVEVMMRLSPASSGTASIGFIDGLLTPTTKFMLLEVTAAGNLQARLAMDGGVTRTVAGPAAVVDDAWHFYGVHVDSVAGQATFRVDNTSTVVAFATWADSTPSNVDFSDAQMTLTSNARIAEIFLSGGRSGFGANGYVTATTPWINENFTPTAVIDKSDLILDTLPPVEYAYNDEWDMLSDIAAAEAAAVYFDVNVFHYRTGKSDTSPTGQTANPTITARAELKDLRYVSGVAQIANSITVPYTAYEPRLDQTLWQPSGAVKVPALSDLEITITIDGVIFLIGAFNSFVTNTQPDGTGAEYSAGTVTWSVSSFGATGVVITLTNTVGVDLWLVNTSGQPTPILIGSWMAASFDTVAPVTLKNSDSIRQYRTQPLTAPGSIWRQRDDVSRMFATRLLSDLSTPHATIVDVPVRGDPRRQLGDLAPIQDRNGLGVDGQFRITGITHEGSPNGGYTQGLTVREASSVAHWNVNYWNDGTVWGVVS